MTSNKPRTSTPRRSSGIGVGGEGGGLRRDNSSSSVILKVEVPKLGNDSLGGSKANLSKSFTVAVGAGGGSGTGGSKQGLMGSAKEDSKKQGVVDLGGGDGFPAAPGLGQHSRDKMTPDFVTNEKILNDICSLYSERELLGAAKAVRAEVTVPKRQVVVLLVGNHSAGKSSFINWYVQDSIMKTGVAIETQGINFILHGSRRETLKGSATLQLFPELGKLRSIPGVVANMITEVSPSKARMFESVVFIDTPGLVDGNMNYPFDINKTLLALGGIADLTFFFFEPVGQALCRRTVDILEEMWADSHEAKIRLVLAKADEAGGDSERQKVMMQIIQELCKRPKINRSGFDMPAIYIPGINDASCGLGYVPFFSSRNTNSSKPAKCANQIDETCKEIEKAVKMNVQNALDNLETDCNEVIKKLEENLTCDEAAKRINAEATRKKTTIWIGIICIILCILAESIAEELNFKSYAFISKLGKPVRLLMSKIFFSQTLAGLNESGDLDLFSKIEWNWKIGLGLVCFLWACNLVVCMIFGNGETVMSKKDRQEIDRKISCLVNVKSKQKMLYKSFLAQSIPDIMLGDNDSRDKEDQDKMKIK